MVTLTKIEIAKMQLEAAIRSFQQNDKIAALTLAGASEEILGKLCERRGKKNILELLKELTSDSGKNLSNKDFNNLFNYPRNALKHANSPDDNEVEILDCDSQEMILRAIHNWNTLELDPSELISDFYKWCKQHPLEIPEVL